MNSSQYEVYKRNTILLAGTLTIKSSHIAKKINDGVLIELGESGLIQSRPETWRYYLNIAGIPHATNSEITVKSLDTREIIPFTRTVLNDHPLTERMYQYGTRFYKELIYLYPSDELLIKGVLYPVDIDTAIRSKDGTILSYKTSLVEEYEVSLIKELEDWLCIKMERWNVSAYDVSNRLFIPAFFAILIQQTVIKIFNLRLARAKTHEVHSYHIYEYLRSHNHLHEFMYYMTREQQLFFYRNIKYIQRNEGLNYVFKTLIEAIFAKRYIAVSDFNILKIDVSDLEWYTDHFFVKNPITRQYNTNPKQNYTSLEFEVKYRDDNVWNPQFLDNQRDEQDKLIKNAKVNRLLTKFIEASSIDYNNSFPYKKDEVYITEWFNQAFKGQFNTYVFFTEPKTGTSISLSTYDAMLYVLYNVSRIFNSDTETIFPFIIRRAYNDDATLESLKETRIRYREAINNDFMRRVKRLVDIKPREVTTQNILVFKDYSRDVYTFNLEVFFEYAGSGGYDRYSSMKHVTHGFFEDKQLNFAEVGQRWEDWLFDRQLLEDDYSKKEREAIVYELIKEATPFDNDDKENGHLVRRAMLGIAKRLTAYSTHWLDDGLDTDFTRLMIPYARINEPYKKTYRYDHYDILIKGLIGSRTRLYREHTGVADIDPRLAQKLILKEPVDVQANIRVSKRIVRLKDPLSKMRFIQEPGTNPKPKIMAYSNYLMLTDEQKKSLIDIY